MLAAQPGNTLLAKWAQRALAYWRGRIKTCDYFWVHHQFGELCAIDQAAFRDWQAVPRISADGPHAIQHVGMFEDYDAAKAQIDWTVPVFKLTHRFDHDRLGPNCLVGRLVGGRDRSQREECPESPRGQPPLPIGLLKTNTENLGDHIQILAGEALLRRAGLEPSFLVDRDDQIAHPPSNSGDGPAGILMNGWFKSNPAEWPPHPAFRPVYLGFHIRLFQSPSLVSPEALEHYAAHAPIGCRDRYTLALLRSHGIECFLSHCLSLTFPRRLPDPEVQIETFVVSRDDRILDYLPAFLGPVTYLSHYSGKNDFAPNKVKASEILDAYKTRARLIVTSMLHCALPAIAMGIPVVVFLPLNEGAAHQSDIERFSSLSEIVRVFRLSEASIVDWRGYTPDLSAVKLRLVDDFFAMAAAWGHFEPARFDGFTPHEELPPYDYFTDPERFERLALAGAPDRQRWGAPSSYKAHWAARGALAAKHIPDGGGILEIGAGTGQFRDLVAARCRYTGADLQPLDDRTLSFDIERDPIPSGPWDVIVLLGVIEYLYDPVAALGKVCASTQSIVFSYCVPRELGPQPGRRMRGWTNALSERELTDAMSAAGFSRKAREDLNSGDEFDERIFIFGR